MALRIPRQLACTTTLTPFLYPSFLVRPLRKFHSSPPIIESDPDDPILASTSNPDHPHYAYAEAPFSDLRTISISAGAGGHGCVSFLREKFIPNGPPNGGDGGSGGSVYIQAVYGETSLHKLGRQGVIAATDGQNGKGSSLNGRRGEDVVIRVPVGTVVTELSRYDPTENVDKHDHNKKWIHYPDSLAANLSDPKFAEAKYPVHHHKSSSQMLRLTHPMRVHLDLSEPTQQPILLLPGSAGGLGNPHFVTPHLRTPKFATKGSKGAKMSLQLELKVLADVGLVGLPNAGKSSFLRAVSGRKARVGEWAFTTLTPNIGTVLIDRPKSEHERFTIADIPGLIADAHLDKGLGLGFLRHVERARALAFVIDLNRPDPVGDLEALWAEVRAYEEGKHTGSGGMTAEMEGAPSGEEVVRYSPDEVFRKMMSPGPGMSRKPWFVVANKADMEGTEERFAALKEHLDGKADVVPISALRGLGVDRVLDVMRSLLGV